MAKYLIVGCTATYGTLHGMYEADIIEADTQEFADNEASEISEDAISTWADMEEIRSQAEYDCELDPDDPDYDDEIDSLIEEILQEEKEYWARKIKDEYQSMSIDELEKELHQNYGVDEFAKIYC